MGMVAWQPDVGCFRPTTLTRFMWQPAVGCFSRRPAPCLMGWLPVVAVVALWSSQGSITTRAPPLVC
eukprot:1161469-Pelagomonas_calceolata.AAC.28